LKKEIEFEGVVFRDDNFFVDKARGLQIIRSLKDLKLDTDWLQITIGALDKEILNSLDALGVNGLCTGWESGSLRILKLINKGITPEDILKKLGYLKEINSFRQVDAVAVIGFPTETWEETKQSINMALAISKLLPNVNLALQTYLPFPGTDLFPLAIKEGFLIPKNVSGWGDYDGFNVDFEITWLKNYPFKNINKRLHYISQYIFLLNRVKRKSSSLTLVKIIFYYLAFFRLRFCIFWFPWEIFILDFYRCRINRLKLKKKQTSSVN
jgi:radical SAM superfamily enzyme YgiQ (UPF0313 family)